ncbi:oxidoreductase, partial [Halobacterium sp. PCN9]|nr:oxidoreductase [Halobacterium bonnevillei]
MPLTDLDRYDERTVGRVGDHAVVVGASMAGMLAGRVLADAVDEVTILDRDPLPTDPVARRGVPQANHVHVLLEPGRAILEALFPRYGEDLRSAGGLDIDAARDLEYHQRGDFLAVGPHRLPMLCASRPLFEALVRRRLAARDDVTLRGDCQFTDYRFDESAGRVTGVSVRDADGERPNSRPTWWSTRLAAPPGRRSGWTTTATRRRPRTRSLSTSRTARSRSSDRPEPT